MLKRTEVFTSDLDPTLFLFQLEQWSWTSSRRTSPSTGLADSTTPRSLRRPASATSTTSSSPSWSCWSKSNTSPQLLAASVCHIVSSRIPIQKHSWIDLQHFFFKINVLNYKLIWLLCTSKALKYTNSFTTLVKHVKSILICSVQLRVEQPV